MPDIVVTWPKNRTLNSYLYELEQAVQENRFICYRVARLPRVRMGDQCYVVHDGFIRGYNIIRDATYMDDVIDPITNERMDSGYYILRYPEWREIEPVEMEGFRGFRYRVVV